MRQFFKKRKYEQVPKYEQREEDNWTKEIEELVKTIKNVKKER